MEVSIRLLIEHLPYMWIVASGEQETRKGVIFYYSKSRSAEIANNLLKGYTNIMVTDRLFRIQ